jgi:transposase-like protein
MVATVDSRRPPFCPNLDCESHRNPGSWRFKKKGFHLRASVPRRIQRYLCQHCQRNFSSQTFAVSYWLRSPQLLRPLFFRVLGCSSLRQIAHEFDVSHTTVVHQVARLGRQCLLLHEQLRPAVPTEALVLDGFRAFEFGHYWPFDLNLVVGVSHFVYAVNEAELRRSGTMRPAQRRLRAALERVYGRPDPQATRRAIAALVGWVVPEGAHVELHSDRHPAYPAALRRLSGRCIRHRTTSSKALRTPGNPLFPVNLADLLLRHTGANHKRETIAFSKRRQGALYRAAIWLVWRNYVKSTSEKRRDDPPGVKLGLIPKRLRVQDILRPRRFPWRFELSPWLERCYYGRIATRRIPNCRSHQLRYAV